MDDVHECALRCDPGGDQCLPDPAFGAGDVGEGCGDILDRVPAIAAVNATVVPSVKGDHGTARAAYVLQQAGIGSAVGWHEKGNIRGGVEF